VTNRLEDMVEIDMVEDIVEQQTNAV